MKNSIIKTISAIALAFAISIALTGTVICMHIRSSWLSSEYMLKTLENTQYYSAVYDAVIDSYEDIGIPSGIPVEVFIAALSLTTVKDDIENNVAGMYTGQPYTVTTDILKSSLKNAFVEYADSIGADISEEGVVEALEELEDYCVLQYVSQVQFPFADEITPYIGKLQKAVDTGLTVCAILTLICAAVLTFIQRINSIKYICSSVIGSGLICALPTAVLLSNAPYKRINVGIQAFYRLAVNFVESGITAVLTTGIVMVVVGMGICVFMELGYPKIFSRGSAESVHDET